MNVVRLDTRQPRRSADAVAVVYDMSRWTVAYYRQGRFIRREPFSSRAAAQAFAEEQVRSGLRWREEGRAR